MGKDLLRYDKLVEKALRGVVRDALAQVAENGLPGTHYFYITFETAHPGVEMPEYLRQQHPEEMTVVLQYQFWDLAVDDEAFEVTLSFNKSPERLRVPFAALVGFADPSVQFGLQLRNIGEGQPIAATPDDEMAADGEAADGEPAPLGGNGNVVTLDSFRKK